MGVVVANVLGRAASGLDMEEIVQSKPAEGWRAKIVRLFSAGLYLSGALAVLRWSAKRVMPIHDHCRKTVFPLIRKRRAPNLQILTYHRVNDEYDPYFPATPVEVFSQQMEYIAKSYEVCQLDEAVEQLGRRDLPDNALVITFDDGYRDNYMHAFPVVRSLNLPMTIFLATDVIGTGVTLWHDRVFSAFRDTKRFRMEGFEREVEGLSLGTLPERLFAMGKVLAALRQLNEAERNSRISLLCEVLEVNERVVDNELMLNWGDVRIMQGYGVSFGSHTASHPILSNVSRDEVERQLQRSCEAIRHHIGVKPVTFAYPNGTRNDFTDVTKEVLRNGGITAAVTTEFGVNEPGADVLELKRGRPWEEHLPTFAFKLSWYRLMSSPAA